MNNAGTENVVRILEDLYAKTEKSFKFLKEGTEEDRMQHIWDLAFEIKGAVNPIFRSRNGIRNYPCVTKIFEPVSGTSFPKELTRDPVTCAKVLYVLCDQYPDRNAVQNIVEDQAFECRAKCDTCYRLAFDEFYRHGTLRCRK